MFHLYFSPLYLWQFWPLGRRICSCPPSAIPARLSTQKGFASLQAKMLENMILYQPLDRLVILFSRARHQERGMSGMNYCKRFKRKGRSTQFTWSTRLRIVEVWRFPLASIVFWWEVSYKKGSVSQAVLHRFFDVPFHWKSCVSLLPDTSKFKTTVQNGLQNGTACSSSPTKCFLKDGRSRSLFVDSCVAGMLRKVRLLSNLTEDQLEKHHVDVAPWSL